VENAKQRIISRIVDMNKLTKLIKCSLPIKISLMAVSAMAILLITSMLVMVIYSRKKVKEETLQKVTLTLDATMRNIDNVLLSVEQTAGNVYFSFLPHIHESGAIDYFSRKMVESNPYVTDCTITFSDSTLSEAKWFLKPYNSEKDSLICFGLPIWNNVGKHIGAMYVDVSMGQLSRIVAQVKPSANSFCFLLDSLGAFIVHPNSERLMQKSAFEFSNDLGNPAINEALEAMVSGETSYRSFSLWGNDYYVFFKPFNRYTMPSRVSSKLGWSVGVVYPENDIFGDYNSLLYYVLAIAIVGLVLMYLLSYLVIKSRLKPLLMLTAKAQHIAEGNFNEPIPDSRHIDEVGRLQDNFQIMQRSLAVQVGELDHLKATLYKRCDDLHEAYNEAKQADRMKTSFLHNMTNQMMAPAEAIEKSVSLLCKSSDCDAPSLISDIQKNGKAITVLLKNLISMSDDDMRKEGHND